MAVDIYPQTECVESEKEDILTSISFLDYTPILTSNSSSGTFFDYLFFQWHPHHWLRENFHPGCRCNEYFCMWQVLFSNPDR